MRHTPYTLAVFLPVAIFTQQYTKLLITISVPIPMDIITIFQVGHFLAIGCLFPRLTILYGGTPYFSTKSMSVRHREEEAPILGVAGES